LTSYVEGTGDWKRDIGKGVCFMGNDWQQLMAGMSDGSVRDLARLIPKVENREPGWLDAMKVIHTQSGKAHVVGITGAPGAGKSTLTDRITRELVARGNSVGIVAVDPSSPFSGGALLGDRIRMSEVSNFDGVFVRSMATRGALGGLSLAARDVVKIMDAFGKDIVLIETVGVGQDEVDVVKTADMVLVVCVPGMGDGIQAIKAGIMEIADIFVVNKADREGADRVVVDIQAMLDMSSAQGHKEIPIFKTTASTGEGVKDLVESFLHGLESGQGQKDWLEERVKEEILCLVEKEVARHVRAQWNKNGRFESIVKDVVDRKRDPYSVVEDMVANLINP
jgi:LAO/AO transport system kinase